MIAAELGVEARFTLVAAGENLDADLRNWVWKGPIVGAAWPTLCCMSPMTANSPAGSNKWCSLASIMWRKWLSPTAGTHIPKTPPVPAYFRFDSVAVENDSIADFYLSAFPGGQLSGNIRRYPTAAAAMAGLDQAEVKAAMGPLAQLEAGLTAQTAVHTPPLPGFPRALGLPA